MVAPGGAHRGDAGAVVVVVLLRRSWGSPSTTSTSQPVTRVERLEVDLRERPCGRRHRPRALGRRRAVRRCPASERRNYGSVTFENFNVDSPDRVEQAAERPRPGRLHRAEQPAAVRHDPARAGRVAGDVAVLRRARRTASWGSRRSRSSRRIPQSSGMTFNDTGAEESFSVYDHPKVTIYKKTDAYSHEPRGRRPARGRVPVPAIGAAWRTQAQNAAPVHAATCSRRSRRAARGRTSSTRTTSSTSYPLFFWLLAIEVAAFALVPLAVVGLPRAARPRVPADEAARRARRWRTWRTRRQRAAGCTTRAARSRARSRSWRSLGIVTGVALARTRSCAWVRERWRFLLFAEALFLLAFLFSYWIRLQNPDLCHP